MHSLKALGQGVIIRVGCYEHLSHVKCCDNSSSAEKYYLFQRNQIFETPSLTAEKVNAAREVEEQ